MFIESDNLMPYKIVSPFLNDEKPERYLQMDEDTRKAADMRWNALPDFTAGRNVIAVADVSDLMYWPDSIEFVCPIDVSVSLAIYFAERCKGAFHNHFITFTSRPELVEVEGCDIAEKAHSCSTADWDSKTNLARVFELLLDTAAENHLPQEEMPSTLYMISYRDFDSCVEGADVADFEHAKKAFEENGYELPKVVFWNVNSRAGQQPVTEDVRGVVMVSGCTSGIFAQVMLDKADERK